MMHSKGILAYASNNIIKVVLVNTNSTLGTVVSQIKLAHGKAVCNVLYIE